ncbi:MAG: hypothetical protein AUJ01_15060 [Acidobacteria bacterium 13_1_40CM_3_65_5]|nr:MAG: hypothetical protein AUJ01_15060 [Acidobacteria bacterium 13_1_40CM_3_65_5]
MIVADPVPTCGQPPQRRPVRRQQMIESRAIDALLANGHPQASADVAWTLPRLNRLKELASIGDLGQHGLMPLVRIRVGQRGRGEEAAQIAEVGPRVPRSRLDPVLIHGFEGIEQREVRLARRHRRSKQWWFQTLFFGADLHVLSEDIPLRRRERVFEGPSSPDAIERCRWVQKQLVARCCPVHPRGTVLNDEERGFRDGDRPAEFTRQRIAVALEQRQAFLVQPNRNDLVARGSLDD